MSQFQLKPEFKGHYIAGEFRKPSEESGSFEVKSPADFSDVLGTIRYAYSDVDRVVLAAQEAFHLWRKLSVADRAQYLKKYQEQIKAREAELVEIISRETGKPLWESKTEVSSMVNKVDITINESMRFIEEFKISNILPETQGACRYKPLGVMAVIGPFNFPGHLPNGHLVPALLTGNTVILKPSEKTPFVAQLMAECAHAAGIPKGVFNVLQGEREVGRRLVVHEGVHGVLFTGSYEVGTRIKQDTLSQHWKLLALEMGGKNASIVWEDADFEHALKEIFFSVFVTAGQRCSCTSRILVHRKHFHSFVEKFHQRAKAFKIGHPIEDPFMGPLIDTSSVDRYLKFQTIAGREGFDIVMRGKILETDYEGNYVTPSICVSEKNSVESAAKGVYQQIELFGPNAAIVAVDNLEEAIAQANVTQYGLVSSVFTASQTTYEKCWQDLQMGLINWNKSTAGASSRLPFGGIKKSGNHFPTGVNATLYCTYPVASLEVDAPKSGKPNFPGLNWE